MSGPVMPRRRRRLVNGGERAELARRYGFTPGSSGAVNCHYCEAEGHATWFFYGRSKVGWFATSLEIDHVVPLASGGTYEPSNLVLACRRCNRSKGCR